MLGFIKRIKDKRDIKLLEARLGDLTDSEHIKGHRLIKTKKGKPLYLVHYVIDSLGIIRIIGGEGLIGRLTYIAETKDNQNKIKIGDIRHEHYNQGIGSELIKYLEDIAKEEGYNSLYGWLSPVDFGHKKRLMHFYRKNKFEITVNNDVQMGGYIINKNL